MRKLFTLVIAVVVLFAGYAKATHKEPTPKPAVVRPDGTGVLIKNKKPVGAKGPFKSKGGVLAFMHKIGHFESNNNYRATNSLGMIGRYQFHPRTIRAMGFRVSNDEFLNNPELQDKVMLAFMRDNKRSLRSIIKKYDGKVVNGVRVTESGVLAASHLAGVGGVLSFFYPEKYQYRVSDSNGASVVMYMKRFGGYDMRGL